MMSFFLQESSLSNLTITCQAVAKTIFDKYFTVHVGVRVLCTSATFCNLLTQELDLYVAFTAVTVYVRTVRPWLLFNFGTFDSSLPGLHINRVYYSQQW